MTQATATTIPHSPDGRRTVHLTKYPLIKAMIGGDQRHARYDAVALAGWSARLVETCRSIGNGGPAEVRAEAWRRLLEQDHAEAVEMHAQRADSAAYAAELAARVELPKRVPGRAARIAAVHMAADFLADRPELPVPTVIDISGGTLSTYEDSLTGVVRDEKARVAELLEWAAANGASLFEASSGIVATVVITAAELHGVTIKYRRHVNFDEAPRPRRYLP